MLWAFGRTMKKGGLQQAPFFMPKQCSIALTLHFRLG